MGTKKYIYIGLAVVVLIGLVVLSVILLKKKPVEWTRENSLLRVGSPPMVLETPGVSNVKALIDAVDFSLAYLGKLDPGEPFTFGTDRFTARQLKESLEDFKQKLWEFGLTDRFFQYVRAHYTFYKSAADEVLFTGYYEALLKGSRERTGDYRYPLYRTPGDLVTIDLSQFSFYEKYKGLPRVLKGRIAKERRVVPYYSREEIDSRLQLAEKDLEMVWINNPIDVFFLQIQGSGIVELDTGEKMRVNYDESNGRPYRAIGRLLVERGLLALEDASMQSIRAYLEAHPGEMEEIFNYNPSYVFFREVEEGPIGCFGVPVTAFRSIATDRGLFPGGGLCYIETELPEFDEEHQIKGWKVYRGFVLNQDTGGAIRTPRRVDLFTGHGEAAELVAGHMKRSGMFYLLVKKNLTPYPLSFTPLKTEEE